ncbi:hypothetical protein EV294_104105 [Paenibacillus sp. BK033]|nr:hypothetical protein [Paenibacillus sp. BK720]TCM96894.1 hypothetical protein EV294_104105 [Paenibacillus sp. BK033]
MKLHPLSVGGWDLALKDYGAGPLVVNLEEAAEQNRNYRTALWTVQEIRPAEHG